MSVAPPRDAANGVASDGDDLGGRLRRRLRLFAHVGDQPRARRATDGILAVGSVVGLILLGLVAVPEAGFSRAVTEFLGSFPVGLAGMWQVLADLPLVWSVVLLIATVTGRRLAIGRDMVAAIAASVAVWLVVARIVEGAWPDLFRFFGDVEPPPVFPSGRMAIATALIVTASPHLVRPARRVGRTLLVVGAVATVVLQATSATGVVASLLVGAAAAAIVHLVLGSSAGRPSLELVREALGEMHVPVTSLGAASRQPDGHFAVDAVGANGERLQVKLYGRDAFDSALVNTVWRSIWLRRPGTPVGLGRLRQVEHEALLTLLAAQAGVATDVVVTAGATSTSDALLVVERTGTRLVEPDRFDVDVLGIDDDADVGATVADATIVFRADATERAAELWALIDRLHRAGIAHGALDEEHLLLADGGLGLAGFQSSTVAATSARRRQDEVQTFVTSVGLLGRPAAVAGLVEHVDAERIEAFLPYLQPTTVTSAQRRMLRALDIDLDDLRSEVAGAIEADEPELVELRRFTVGTVLKVALPALALFILISALAGFDLDEFVTTLRTAVIWLVVVGFVIAQLPRFAQAVSTLGASPVPLPLGPVYALQLAVSYVNLAVPSAAARIAVNVRFFQRQGVSPTAAAATGALDGVSGFVVQAILLGSLLAFTGLSLDVDLGDPASAAVRVVLIVGAVVAAAIVVIAVVPALRRRAVGGVRHVVREAVGVARGLRSPRRLAMLFGGNLAAEMLFASALGLFVLAFGYSVPLHELLFINMAVALLSGVLPVPGGVGVTEGGLIFGLTAFGVPSEAAFAAVILYRLATFYTPPIWGFFAFRWLEQRRYL